MSSNSTVLHHPVDAVTERLNDPAVAASLVSLLDNVEMLSTLVTGLNEFFERGDTIIDSVASGVREFKDARAAGGSSFDLTKFSADAKALMSTLNEAMPVLREALPLLHDALPVLNEALPTVRQLLSSGMVNDEVIELLATVSTSAVEGARAARANDTTVKGVLGTLKALKDPDVQRGMGLLVEIAKALGTNIKTE